MVTTPIHQKQSVTVDASSFILRRKQLTTNYKKDSIFSFGINFDNENTAWEFFAPWATARGSSGGSRACGLPPVGCAAAARPTSCRVLRFLPRPHTGRRRPVRDHPWRLPAGRAAGRATGCHGYITKGNQNN